ncbi:MAG: sigma 54-interacting transcriptional regulator [Candidatus Latescibacterota bacterium]
MASVDLRQHLLPPDCDRPLARLSFSTAPERRDALAEEYDRVLRPILRAHGLEDAGAPGRPLPPGVYSRLLGLDTPVQVGAQRQALQADASWRAALSRLARTFAPLAPPAHLGPRRRRQAAGDGLPWRLGLFAAPAGAGHRVEAAVEARQAGRLAVSRQTGLPPGLVVDLLEDRGGEIWMAMVGAEACRFDGACFTTYGVADGLPSDHVVRGLQDGRGHVWFGTSEGVAVFDGAAFACLAVDDGLPFGFAFPLVEDRAGRVWVSAGVPVPQQLVMVPRHGSALVRLGSDGLRTYTRADGLPDDRVLCALQTRSGEVWFGTAGGACVLGDDGVVRTCAARDGLAHDLVSALLEDRDGALWLGTGANGVSRLRNGHVEDPPPRGLPHSQRHLRHPAGPRGRRVGGLPESLVESEQFGHEKGAFTGAVARKLGKVELAREGTLFLDGIGDLPLAAQVKLLRFLEEGTFERVGGTQTLQAEVRVVAATNRDLQQMVAGGAFRADLFYRLEGFSVRLPALRERREDIVLLALYVMEKMAAHLGRQVTQLEPEALSLLQAYAWPGNVRELEHAVQRAVIVCREPVIRAADLAPESGTIHQDPSAGRLTPEEYERRYILSALEQADWLIKGSSGAAARLGLSATTLRRRMERLGIRRP